MNEIRGPRSEARGPAVAVQAIVFDFDGVLADSEPLHLRSYQEIFEPHGVKLDTKTYCDRYLGFDDEGAFRQIIDDNGLMLGDEEIELLLREKSRRFEALVSGVNVLYPGAAACARALSAVWPVGVASGALRHEIELMLRGAALLDTFTFIVAAGETDRTKPAPDPYLRAAELHGVPPAACVAIEDSHWGLESARTAGMRTIAITHTYPREKLTGDADLVVDTLEEITPELIRRFTNHEP
ncbi:MAG: HAD family phosphatase [Acidobacteria bacterium]|nr:MAG: HAD family phosphatase [Acidobacteriota bacterium]